nr:hypothetical protein [uncultured Tyzzerella sp.]
MSTKDKQVLINYINLRLDILAQKTYDIDSIYICRYINLILKAYDITVEDIRADIKAEFNYNIKREVIEKILNIEREVMAYK